MENIEWKILLKRKQKRTNQSRPKEREKLGDRNGTGKIKYLFYCTEMNSILDLIMDEQYLNRIRNTHTLTSKLNILKSIVSHCPWHSLWLVLCQNRYQFEWNQFQILIAIASFVFNFNVLIISVIRSWATDKRLFETFPMYFGALKWIQQVFGSNSMGTRTNKQKRDKIDVMPGRRHDR